MRETSVIGTRLIVIEVAKWLPGHAPPEVPDEVVMVRQWLDDQGRPITDPQHIAACEAHLAAREQEATDGIDKRVS